MLIHTVAAAYNEVVGDTALPRYKRRLVINDNHYFARNVRASTNDPRLLPSVCIHFSARNNCGAVMSHLTHFVF